MVVVTVCLSCHRINFVFGPCVPFRKGGNTEGGLLSGRTARRRVLRVTLPGDGRPGGSASQADFLAGEEPLGIRVDGTALTITMRTPGDDLELAAGFLVSEAVIRSPADIAEIKLCDGTACGHADHNGMGNIADVTLAPGVTVTPGARRNFLTTSACGICGKASIEDICVLPHTPPAADTARFAPSLLAVDLAEQAGLTLVGFLRDPSMNVYTGAHRLSA